MIVKRLSIFKLKQNTLCLGTRFYFTTQQQYGVGFTEKAIIEIGKLHIRIINWHLPNVILKRDNRKINVNSIVFALAIFVRFVLTDLNNFKTYQKHNTQLQTLSQVNLYFYRHEENAMLTVEETMYKTQYRLNI